MLVVLTTVTACGAVPFQQIAERAVGDEQKPVDYPLAEVIRRNRQVMTPGHYTELFFLDEATALAAGHRPCPECRRERFNAYRCAIAAHGATDELSPLGAIEIDRRLHAERLVPGGTKRTYSAELDTLPDGVFVLPQGRDRAPHLVSGGSLLVWSVGGYTGRFDRPRGVAVELLTPELTVRAIRGGYGPEWHPSARGFLDRQA